MLEFTYTVIFLSLTHTCPSERQRLGTTVILYCKIKNSSQDTPLASSLTLFISQIVPRNPIWSGDLENVGQGGGEGGIIPVQLPSEHRHAHRKTNSQAVKTWWNKKNPKVSCVMSSSPDDAKLSATWPSSLKYCSPSRAGVWWGIEFFCMDNDVGIRRTRWPKRIKTASGPDPDGSRVEWVIWSKSFHGHSLMKRSSQGLEQDGLLKRSHKHTKFRQKHLVFCTL